MSSPVAVEPCPGPLIWFDVGVDHSLGAVLECAACGYIVCTGNFHEPAHAETPLLREGLAA